MSTVEQALAQERKNINFSTTKISQFLYGKQFYHRLRPQLQKRPVIPLDLNLHNKGRIGVLKQAIKDLPLSFNHKGNFMKDDVDFTYSILNCHSQMPSSVHYGMFLKCIEIMGTEQQKKEYLEAGQKLQIHGCYAQTQIGHGSDVRSLMTTATYDSKTQQFIMDSPKIQAAKFWPGQLGLFATHALLYANLIINGKQHGIQSFIVPIRDPKTMEPLPNIDVGDIGPKIGFYSKDNGYMLLNKVRIPRKNMLSKFTQVLPNGDIIEKGNPKISYATMMEIRKYICSCFPKIYASGITIATRYSMFRRQFKNSAKEEIKVIDYQLQQDKIISRVSQYFAVILAGNRINQMCKKMLQYASEKEDFSLMPQTHACLCIGKPLISEIVYDGLQICRKACGGHGFSQYSGFPTIINQYACHLTHEGENTVLYLQTARYLLKSYKNLMTGKGSLPSSVKYIESYNYLIEKKCEIQNPQMIKMEDIRIILAQATCYLLGVVSQKMMNKDQADSPLDVWNKRAGNRLKQLSMHHGIYFIFNTFMQSVLAEGDEKIRQITTKLCLIFGINMILNFSGPILEGDYVNAEQLKIFRNLKQNLLKQIRPILIGIVDGFGIPDKYIRSALISGNPYENFIKLARQNELNHQRLQSVNVVRTIKQQIRNPNPKL